MRFYSNFLPIRFAFTRCPGVKPVCRTRKWSRTFSSSIRPFTLEDELTTEIKKAIESKWGNKVYGTSCPENGHRGGKPMYVLSMFPYPSGRLHLGHVRVYTISDILARFHRLQGQEVVHPMGWDAFGLPAENAARDRGVDPAEWTKDNISAMKKQIIEMGCCFDWNRELATCDPAYYRWSQWLFLKLWQEGLAYKKQAYVYWDPVDQTVLAEEQVDTEMRSWRSGAVVEKKLLSQWFIRTAVFAKQLADNLDSDLLRDGWRDIIDMQKHWIGEIHGYFSDCTVFCDGKPLPDTLRLWFSSPQNLQSAKFALIQADHPLAKDDALVLRTLPNGVKQLNVSVVNPASGLHLPVFSGGPNAPIVPESSDLRVDEILTGIQVYESIATNDGSIEDIRKACNFKQTEQSEQNPSFTFHPSSLKLHDWLVSRQRNWGTPIPAVNCSDCGQASAVDDHLLPFNKNSDISSVKCKHCGGANVSMETDTLDTFFDSSWYFFRYLDVDNSEMIFNPKKVSPFLPVGVYVGGKEHATLHLYYARFMTHFLEKLGLSSVKEPFQNLIPVGVVMGESYKVTRTGRYITKDQVEQREKKLVDKETGLFVAKKWEKMSKSKYNGIDPNEVINEHGIDTTRLLSISDAAPSSFRKWPSSQFPTYINFQKKMWLAMRDFVQRKEEPNIVVQDDDDWRKLEDQLFDKKNYYLKEVIHTYETTRQISVTVSRLQALFNHLMKFPRPSVKDSVQYERMLGTGLICLYPIMPAFSAQLWQSFRDVASFTENEFDLDREIWLQKFPEVDQDYNLDLVCEVMGAEVSAIKVPRCTLDDLDVNVAVEMALEQPEVAKKISSRETCAVISYKLKPGYKAILNVKCVEKERETLGRQQAKAAERQESSG